MPLLGRRACLVTARVLTLGRVVLTPLFLVLLVRAAGADSRASGAGLLLLYAVIALSDVVDGRLARRAGVPTAFWGRMDAGADILFNTLSLAVAAWLGRIGPWVPAGIAVLAGRFILRNLRPGASTGSRPREDAPGKAAGVLYYLLVGAVTLEVAVAGDTGRWWVARAGDAVFAYTLLVLVWARGRRPAPPRPSRSW
jgi:CDP-diacylglycerol--glycerol-3-phosphate 3-phosphatidyltransferase